MRLLSLARDLRRRKARERQALFVVEGVRGVEELLASGLPVRGGLVAPQLADAPRGRALQQALAAAQVTVENVDERDFASAAGTESPQGVLAIAPVPARTFADIPPQGVILLLDGVQDPGNVGAVLRTAAALGAAATVALPGTVDLWNAKVVRAAVGAHFRHVAFHAPWPDVEGHLRGLGIPVWVAAREGTPVRNVALPPRVALALGNEGAGVSAPVAAAAQHSVSVPMEPHVESLNVAVAAGILLDALRSV